MSDTTWGMSERQAQNAARALCGEHGAYELVEGRESWSVRIPINGDGQDVPFGIVLTRGGIRLQFEVANVPYETSYGWKTGPPQSMDEEGTP